MFEGWGSTFEGWGSTEDPVPVARAPGRVNLIGEHTDYNQGLALPAAISLPISIAFRPRTDRRAELHSLALGETRAFDLDLVRQPRSGGENPRPWIDYAAGMAWALNGADIPLRGVQGVIESRLPIGSGLSSSAAGARLGVGTDRPRERTAPVPRSLGGSGPPGRGGIRRRAVRCDGPGRLHSAEPATRC